MQTQIKVRGYHLDVYQHVNNARYLEFLEERGIHVPEDLSVVSFDDAELQDTTDIKLLSAIHPKNKLGRITGNHLLRMMDDENWQTKNYA